jgi:hypothetical protein
MALNLIDLVNNKNFEENLLNFKNLDVKSLIENKPFVSPKSLIANLINESTIEEKLFTFYILQFVCYFAWYFSYQNEMVANLFNPENPLAQELINSSKSGPVALVFTSIESENPVEITRDLSLIEIALIALVFTDSIYKIVMKEDKSKRKLTKENINKIVSIFTKDYIIKIIESIIIFINLPVELNTSRSDFVGVFFDDIKKKILHQFPIEKGLQKLDNLITSALSLAFIRITSQIFDVEKYKEKIAELDMDKVDTSFHSVNWFNSNWFVQVDPKKDLDANTYYLFNKGDELLYGKFDDKTMYNVYTKEDEKISTLDGFIVYKLIKLPKPSFLYNPEKFKSMTNSQSRRLKLDSISKTILFDQLKPWQIVGVLAKNDLGIETLTIGLYDQTINELIYTIDWEPTIREDPNLEVLPSFPINEKSNLLEFTSLQEKTVNLMKKQIEIVKSTNKYTADQERILAKQIEYVKNLTTEQKNSLYSYTVGSGEINSSLRGYRTTPQALEKIKNIDKVFEGIPPLEEPLTVYRGITVSDNSKILRKGDLVYDRAYQSTSLYAEYAYLQFVKSNCCLFIIRLPKGSQVVPLTPIESYKNEFEILLNHGSLLKEVRNGVFVDSIFYELEYVSSMPEDTEEPTFDIDKFCSEIVPNLLSKISEPYYIKGGRAYNMYFSNGSQTNCWEIAMNFREEDKFIEDLRTYAKKKQMKLKTEKNGYVTLVGFDGFKGEDEFVIKIENKNVKIEEYNEFVIEKLSLKFMKLPNFVKEIIKRSEKIVSRDIINVREKINEILNLETKSFSMKTENLSFEFQNYLQKQCKESLVNPQKILLFEISPMSKAVFNCSTFEVEKETDEVVEHERVVKEAIEKKAERERVAKEEAERVAANAEIERIVMELADKVTKEATEKEEMERVAKEEAERERVTKEEAERVAANAEIERIVMELADKVTKEATEKEAERERVTKEKAERVSKEDLTAEMETTEEADRESKDLIAEMETDLVAVPTTEEADRESNLNFVEPREARAPVTSTPKKEELLKDGILFVLNKNRNRIKKIIHICVLIFFVVQIVINQRKRDNNKLFITTQELNFNYYLYWYKIGCLSIMMICAFVIMFTEPDTLCNYRGWTILRMIYGFLFAIGLSIFAWNRKIEVDLSVKLTFFLFILVVFPSIHYFVPIILIMLLGFMSL